MKSHGVDYWGPVIVAVGLIAVAASFLVFRDATLYWAVAFSGLLAIAGGVMVGYRRIR